MIRLQRVGSESRPWQKAETIMVVVESLSKGCCGGWFITFFVLEDVGVFLVDDDAPVADPLAAEINMLLITARIIEML